MGDMGMEMNTAAAAAHLSLRRDQGLWLLAAAALTLAPHLISLPAWIIATCAALLAWRGGLLWAGKAAPPRWILLPLLLGIAICIRLDFDSFLGKTPGLAFLTTLLGLKLLETRNMRDIRVVTLLCFFLQFGLFFNDQSLPAAVLALLALLVTLGSQIALADPASRSRERFKTSAILLAQGLPFMLACFLLFPRLPPLWGIPGETVSITGLSDSMSPGTISQVILSDELAFTAKFDGPRPAVIERYWRGPVLSRFDGQTWRAIPLPPRDTPAYAPKGRRFHYQMMLEPHNQHWLPTLAYPAGPVEGVRFTYDYQTLSRHPVNTRQQIAFSTHPDTRAGLDEPPWVLRQARQLPAHGNPRTRALAAGLQADTPAKTVERILDWLTEGQRFTYTLQPPLFDDDSIDFFLFDSRMGFCEHFAGAFVFLARAADVPARVVTGYQGGRIHPYSGALSVRQSDAHAWAEVWLAGRGWVRVDPTALVAPQRIDRGLEGALETGLPFMLLPEYSWLRQLRDHWEGIATQWNHLLAAYDGRRQRDLLASLGLQEFSISPTAALGGIALAVALLMAAFYLWMLRRRENIDPLDRAWARFSARLAPHGLARARAEGPLDYSRRLAAARPLHATKLISICTHYACLRYRPPASLVEVRKFIRSIETLDIEKQVPDSP